MDTNYHEELNENQNTFYKGKFTEEIQNLLYEKLITKNEYDHKTHKIIREIPTFRLICNGIGSCSVRMSEFLDNFLRLLCIKKLICKKSN